MCIRDSLYRAIEPVVKRSFNVDSVKQLPRILHRAFNIMLTGRKGPVQINLPMDVQCDSIEIDRFPEPIRFRGTEKICADYNIIKKAVDYLIKAERPVILVGGGLIHSGAFNELKELAELIGAAVITTMMGKSAFPENHELYGWHTGSKGTTVGLKLTRSADVILALGTRFADETTSSYRYGVSFSIPPTNLFKHFTLCHSFLNIFSTAFPIELAIP